MKTLSIFIIALALMGMNEGFAQWNTSGNNIYNTNTGNVGIGTSEPATLLHVGKNMTEPAITVSNMGGAGGATYSMIDNNSGAYWKFKATLSGGFKIRDHANGLDVFTIEANSAANTLFIKSGGSLGIGTASPDNSALVDMTSATKGFLLPRMNHAALNSIPSPAEGLLVYCTDCSSNGSGAMAIFMAGTWHSLFFNNCLDQLPAPAEGTHVPDYTQIVWNWNTVPGAAGYKWNITNNYATATDMGTGTTKTETGLTCGTSYIRYAWSYNSCGASTPVSLSQSTSGSELLTYPGAAHTVCQCIDAGGTVTTVTEGSNSYTLCKFTGTDLNPPGGWSQASYWQKYNHNGGNGDNCLRFIGTLPTVWSNTSGTAYGCGGYLGQAFDCATWPSLWHISSWPIMILYEVQSANNPSSYWEGTSGTNVTRLEIGCK